jgi:ABC-type antimicrobial peptide transport system permease subunit
MKRVIASKLTTPAAADAGPLLATAAILIMVTAIAAFLPIRRAMTIDPMVALRRE